MENVLIFNGQTLSGDAELMDDLFRQSHISDKKGDVVKYMVLNAIEEYFEARWTNDDKDEVYASPDLVKYVRACGVKVVADLSTAVSRGEITGQVAGFKPFSKIERQARIETKQRYADEIAICSSLAKSYQEQAKKFKDDYNSISKEITAKGQEVDLTNPHLFIIGDKAVYLNESDEVLSVEALKSEHMMHMEKRHVEFDGKHYWVYFSPSSEEIVRVQELTGEELQMEVFTAEKVSGEIIFESGTILSENEQLGAFLRFQGYEDYEGSSLQVLAEDTARLDKAISPARELRTMKETA